LTPVLIFQSCSDFYNLYLLHSLSTLNLKQQSHWNPSTHIKL
jgi:hypothetical protein